jgi:5-methyltetrahydrofolate--homocysteine methyltransferase
MNVDSEAREIFGKIGDAVIAGDMIGAPELTRQALASGFDAVEIMNGSLIPAMSVVGDKFESKEYFVPEVLVSARAMQAALDLLRPLLDAGSVEPLGRVAIGTVKGDLHDIGKNIVAMVLTGAGMEVENLGADVAPQAFVEAAERGAQIIGMSSLLTTTRQVMVDAVALLESRGLRGTVKVLVGGAAVTDHFADEIGADAYASDATDALRKAKSLLGVQ